MRKKFILMIFCVSFLFLTSCNNQTLEKSGNFPHKEIQKNEDSKVEEQPQIPKQPEVTTLNLTAVGDLMVHEWQLEDSLDKKTKSYDFEHNFEKVKQYISKADFAVGNLETVLDEAYGNFTGYPMFNSPASFASAIKDTGFDLVTTANNHSNDRFTKGVFRTINILDKIGLYHVGTYASEEESQKIFIKEINKIKVAFLSYSYGTNGIAIPKGMEFSIHLIDDEKIERDIKKAKEQGAELVVVMPHMGIEYAEAPSEDIENFCNMMFQSGADIVLANHPHVLQKMEFKNIKNSDGTERRCFVIYSLGNFISSQRTEPRDCSIILNIQIEKTEGQKPVIKQVSFIPTWVQFVSKKGGYLIRTLPIYDVLKDLENGNDNNLRPKDIVRIKAAQKEIVQKFLSQPQPLKEEYIFEGK